ncbi:MAG: hypothetical protein ACI4WQ_08850 [Sharpea porci]
MSKVKNEEGSTIVAVVIVTMLVLILTGAMYMLAQSYYNRSVRNNDERQAYLYAKSEVKIIADNLKKETGSFTTSVYYPKDASGTWNLNLSKTSNVGSKNYVKLITKNICEYKVTTKDDGSHVVTYKVTVGYNNRESTVSIDCTIDNKNKVEIGKYY